MLWTLIKPLLRPLCPRSRQRPTVTRSLISASGEPTRHASASVAAAPVPVSHGHAVCCPPLSICRPCSTQAVQQDCISVGRWLSSGTSRMKVHSTGFYYVSKNCTGTRLPELGYTPQVTASTLGLRQNVEADETTRKEGREDSH